MMQTFNLGMIGGGTVGSGVFHALQVNGDLMASRIGVKVNVHKVAVKALDEARPYEIPTALMTTDWKSVVNDPEVHLVTDDHIGCQGTNTDTSHRLQGIGQVRSGLTFFYA